MEPRTLVDVARVGLLPGLAPLLLLARGSGGLLASLFLLGRCFTSWGLATSSRWLLLGGFSRHFR